MKGVVVSPLWLWFWFTFSWWLVMMAIFSPKYLLTTCIYSFENCLMKYFALFSTGLIFLLLSLLSCWQNQDSNHLSNSWYENTFSPFCWIAVHSIDNLLSWLKASEFDILKIFWLLLPVLLGFLSKKSTFIPMSWNTALMFSSKQLHRHRFYKVRSSIDLELICGGKIHGSTECNSAKTLLLRQYYVDSKTKTKYMMWKL